MSNDQKTVDAIKLSIAIDESVDVLLDELEQLAEGDGVESIHLKQRLLRALKLDLDTEESKPDDQPMTQFGARAFERKLMPWGNYKGQPIKDVPMQYLCALVDPSDFKRELRRYIKSQDQD